MAKDKQSYICIQCDTIIGTKAVIDHLLPSYELICKECIVRKITTNIIIYDLSLINYITELNKRLEGKEFCLDQIYEFEQIIVYHQIIKLLIMANKYQIDED